MIYYIYIYIYDEREAVLPSYIKHIHLGEITVSISCVCLFKRACLANKVENEIGQRRKAENTHAMNLISRHRLSVVNEGSD